MAFAIAQSRKGLAAESGSKRCSATGVAPDFTQNFPVTHVSTNQMCLTNLRVEVKHLLVLVHRHLHCET
jgi:hypothetical protein